MIKEVPCLECRGRGLISKFSEKSAWLERCPNCKGTGVITVVVTNADRIGSMSDEELAIWLCEKMDCSICKRNIQSDGECDNYSKNGVSMAILNWLQSPAEEDT